MKFGITYAVAGGGQPVGEMFRDAVEQIQLAESLGFDISFVSEHHFLRSFDFVPSPLIALAYIAAKTNPSTPADSQCERLCVDVNGLR